MSISCLNALCPIELFLPEPQSLVFVYCGGTSFNSTWPKWEMVQIAAIRLYQTATLAVPLDLNNWTGCQILAMITPPVMHHMREATSLKSLTRREWLEWSHSYHLFYPCSARRGVTRKLNNWTGCQILATITSPMMRHMREATSSKSPTGREWLEWSHSYHLFYPCSAQRGVTWNLWRLLQVEWWQGECMINYMSTFWRTKCSLNTDTV